MNQDSTSETVRKALDNAEIGLTQEIDETLQGEAVTKLVEESNKYFENLSILRTADNFTTGYLQVLDGDVPIEPPTYQWVASPTESEQPDVYFCKKRVTSYEGALCVTDGMVLAQGIISVDATFLGDKSSAPHTLRLIRELGAKPELSVSSGEFSRIRFENVQSIVLVRQIDDKTFVAAFSGLTTEYCHVSNAKEELSLDASKALPWKCVS